MSIQAEPETKLHPLRQGANMPLWLQLKHALRDLVTFELRPGDRIPSETQICSFYNLSRITVRQAITSLVDEGLLDRQQGRGTYVLSPRLVLPLADQEHFLLNGFDASAPENISVFSKEIVEAADWFGVPLGLANDEPVYKIRKVLKIDNDSVAFRTSFVPCHLTPDLLDADLSPPMALVLEQNYRLVAAEADEVIEFIIADEFRGGMLGVGEGHPLILVSRLVFLESKQPLELSRTYYKADRFRFERHLTR